ncbi:MAG TPA: YvrJ family protein [Tissierellaceae bacterium]
MDELITMIANIGFPIVVSIYLLVRIEEKLDQLSNSILELSNVINKMV